MSVPAISAGWYVCPSDSALMRWWDGSAWTEHVQVKPAPAPVPAAAAPLAVAPPAPLASAPVQPADPAAAPPDAPQSGRSGLAIGALVLAIFGLMLFPLPAGLASVIMGERARRKCAESGGQLRGATMARIAVIISAASILLRVSFLLLASFLAINAADTPQGMRATPPSAIPSLR